MNAIDRGSPAGHRWALWALAAYGVAVVVVLILPIGYAQIVDSIGSWGRDALGWGWFGTGWIEFAANILMFAPLGFLLTLLFRHPWYGVALALVMSAGAEIAQIVIPSRQPSLRDVIANVLGAVLGAFLAWLFVLRREHLRARRAEAARMAGAAHTSAS